MDIITIWVTTKMVSMLTLIVSTKFHQLLGLAVAVTVPRPCSLHSAYLCLFGWPLTSYSWGCWSCGSSIRVTTQMWVPNWAVIILYSIFCKLYICLVSIGQYSTFLVLTSSISQTCLHPCLTADPISSQIPEALSQEQEDRKKEREAARKRVQRKAKKERLKVSQCFTAWTFFTWYDWLNAQIYSYCLILL